MGKVFRTCIVAAVGMAVSSPIAQAQKKASWAWPVAPSHINYYFFDPKYWQEEKDPSKRRQHLGLDIHASAGDVVSAPVNGRVVTNETSRNVDEAYLVIQDSSTHEEHVLGHISSNLRPGADVVRGKPVGSVRLWPGNTHLHWGVNRGSIAAVSTSSPEGLWGWGRAPVKATEAQAKARGWVNLNSSGPG